MTAAAGSLLKVTPAMPSIALQAKAENVSLAIECRMIAS
jgi:hypothetical protein